MADELQVRSRPAPFVFFPLEWINRKSRDLVPRSMFDLWDTVRRASAGHAMTSVVLAFPSLGLARTSVGNGMTSLGNAGTSLASTMTSLGNVVPKLGNGMTRLGKRFPRLGSS